MYWVDFDPARGSEQQGVRPAVVISPYIRNKNMKTVVIAACTTKFDNKPYLGNVRNNESPLAYFLPKGSPSDQDTAILCFQTLTVTSDRLEGYIGELSDEQVIAVDKKIAQMLALIPSLNGKSPVR